MTSVKVCEHKIYFRISMKVKFIHLNIHILDRNLTES